LEEALRTIHNGSVALVEHKQGDARTCVELLQRMELADQVVVQSFDWDFVRNCHELAPRMALAALGKEELTEEKLDAIAATGANVVGWDHKHVGRAQIEAIHRRGWQAWVYTVNDPARARELAAAGIDGIITDAPALVRSEIGQAASTTPAAEAAPVE
jgi:glycerophosphoryl diester phosphodiesterase